MSLTKVVVERYGLIGFATTKEENICRRTAISLVEKDLDFLCRSVKRG